MSRNQKAPLLAFVLVALVCCMVLVDSMRGDASDGQEAASSSPSASSTPSGDADLTDPSSDDEDEPAADAPFEPSPPFGQGSTGSVRPGSGAPVTDESVLGVSPASPPDGILGELEPGAGGAAGVGQEPDATAPPYPGGTETAEEVGEASPRKAKRRGKGKDLTDHLPDDRPGTPGAGQPDPEQPGHGPPGDSEPGDGQPGNGQPGDGQPGAGSPSGGPSPAVTETPDSANLLTLPDLTPRTTSDQGKTDQGNEN